MIKLTTENISVSKSVANSIYTPSTVIYNCYDDAVFKAENTAERMMDFVFVGRLVSQKGCDVLIKACVGLPKPFKLTIIGDGPEMEDMKDLVNKLQLTGQVVFTGTLSSVEIAAVLNQHKTLVIPSREKKVLAL